jgi:hypothetical protein
MPSSFLLQLRMGGRRICFADAQTGSCGVLDCRRQSARRSLDAARWPNAGFFIHAHEVDNGWPKSFEVQGYFGEAGSLFGVRGGKITGAKRGDFVKDRPPFGSWDKYEITSLNGVVKVVLNGVLVNEGRDADPAEGNICLQSEGWPVYYRNVAIKELK